MELNKKSRVLVVDDHPLVCKAVSQLLNRQTDLICCETVQSASKTATAIMNHRPDLVLLDLRLKDGDGMKLLESLLLEFPGLRVLVLSQFDDLGFVESALKAGACGYVTKFETARDLVSAIRKVLAGQTYLNRKISSYLQKDLEVTKPPVVNGHAPLTQREAQILQLFGVGMNTRSVAAKFNLSIKTIETHRENLKRKLGLKSSSELNHFAICWVERQSSG